MSKTLNEFLDCLCAKLKAAFGKELHSIVLFGSQARGTARPDSDIDILFVFENLSKSCFERDSIIRPMLDDVSERFGRPLVSAILLSAEEMKDHPRVLLDMVEDAEIILDDGVFTTEIAALKRRMTELDSRRVFLDDGAWYWILKPGLQPGETITL